MSVPTGPSLGDVVSAAEALYDPSLPYHNFSHALRALSAAEVLLDSCERDGVTLDGDVVRWAVLFHDAGYVEDPSLHGCTHREAYAALLAERELLRLGASPDRVALVVEAVLATHADARPSAPEALVVRAADLAEVAGVYERFEENSRLLHEEAELLHGRPLPMDEWCASMRSVLSSYLDEDIRLTSAHDVDGVSVFHSRALANLERYLAEHAP